MEPIGSLDRSPPHRVANRTAAERVAAIGKLRLLRMTATEITEALAMPLSTVSAIRTRLSLGKLERIGLERPNQYEPQQPGGLIHSSPLGLGWASPVWWPEGRLLLR